jgi:hypothetical protein
MSDLAGFFRKFSDVESQEMSPFYSYLAGSLADDSILLEIVSATGVGQPPANMIFAAVRLLLDGGRSSELLGMYPESFEDDWSADSYAVFREFVISNRSDIETVLSTRRVQSNVVRRSAVLLPGLIESARSFSGQASRISRSEPARD